MNNFVSDSQPPHIVIMGVCGSGKTTVAGILADRIGVEVAEADDFHPPENVRKMASGIPLADEDRWPWLNSLKDWMNKKADNGKSAVITCSALKRSYRDLLRECHFPVVFVHLNGSPELLAQRLASRTDHFMPPELLTSQLATLEPLAADEAGYVFDIGPTPQQITTAIMTVLGLKSRKETVAEVSELSDVKNGFMSDFLSNSEESVAGIEVEELPKTQKTSADIGVYGLGVMGAALARNLAAKGFKVAVYNLEEKVTNKFISDYQNAGDFIATDTPETFIATLRSPKIAVMMVTAGEVTDIVTKQLADLCAAGDIIVDMGNSHFADTRRREADLKQRGIHFVGCGTSGGQEGALRGPSLMIGGSAESYLSLEPIFTAIAARTPAAEVCSAHVGTDGAGHFVKMVHNGIEYADMQLISEVYALLRDFGFDVAEIGEIFSQWNEGELSSYLVEITSKILSHVDSDTGLPFIDVISDVAGNKGTGIWTVQQALSLETPATGITDATLARMLSAAESTRKTIKQALGEPSKKIESFITGASLAERQTLVADIRSALYAAKIVVYAQGLDIIRAGAANYGWEIDIAKVAQLWRAGCIIRADFLDDVAQAYRDNPRLESLIAAPKFSQALSLSEDAWRRVNIKAIERAVPTPALASTLHYIQAMRAEVLPTALIQAQRDFFGAHTYLRRDREGRFHTHWEAVNFWEEQI